MCQCTHLSKCVPIESCSISFADYLSRGVRALAPSRAKTENCFHQFLLIGLLEEQLKCKIGQNSGIYLNFTVALVTKMDEKIGLKQRNFGPLRLLETDFLRIRYQHS